MQSSTNGHDANVVDAYFSNDQQKIVYLNESPLDHLMEERAQHDDESDVMPPVPTTKTTTTTTTTTTTPTIAQLQPCLINHSIAVSCNDDVFYLWSNNPDNADDPDASYQTQEHFDKVSKVDKQRKIQFLRDDSNKLGFGSFGRVYLGIYPTSDSSSSSSKNVAVKLTDCRSAQTEVSVYQKAGYHPNIVKLLHHGMTKMNEPALVLELMEMNLSSLIGREGGVGGLDRAQEIARNVASANSHLLDCGFLNPDICTDNICIDKDGVAKVLDFGHACHVGYPTLKTGRPEYTDPNVLRAYSCQSNEFINTYNAMWNTKLSIKPHVPEPLPVVPQVSSVNPLPHHCNSESNMVYAYGWVVHQMLSSQPTLCEVFATGAVLPDGLPAAATDLVNACLSPDYNARPTFKQIVQHLSDYPWVTSPDSHQHSCPTFAADSNNNNNL
eukprot:gene1388-1601_t